MILKLYSNKSLRFYRIYMPVRAICRLIYYTGKFYIQRPQIYGIMIKMSKKRMICAAVETVLQWYKAELFKHENNSDKY